MNNDYFSNKYIFCIILIINIFIFIKNKPNPKLLSGKCNHNYVLYKEVTWTNQVKSITGYSCIYGCTKCKELIKKRLMFK